MRATLESILEQIRGVWRFRRTAMLVAWIVCLIGWLVVLALPDTYSAWARVYIDTRTRLGQVTKDIAVDPSVPAEAAAVREALLGRPQLEKVARLAIPAYSKSSPAQQRGIVEGLRKRLQIDSNEGGPRNQPADLYTITYTDRDRLIANRVVGQLLQLFLSSSLGDTEEGAEQAQQFLKQQIAQCEKQLQAAEARIADFKRQNAGLLPGGETGDYFSRLQAAKEQLENLRSALQLAEQKRDELRSTAVGTGATETAAEIHVAKKRLDELLLQYTEAHPDVIAARQTLEDLKARRPAEIAALRRGDPDAIAVEGLGQNPVYQQLIQANVEVAQAKRQVEVQEAKIAELQKLINTAPQVEADYARLKRDYDATRAQHQVLVDRLNRTNLSDQAAERGVVLFKVVDPPTGSDTPVSPDRPRLILLVLLGGLVAGLGLAYLLHQLRPVFASPRQLSEITQLPVLGIVDMAWRERYVAQQRRAMWAYSAATAVLVLVAGIVLLIQSATSQLLHGLMA